MTETAARVHGEARLEACRLANETTMVGFSLLDGTYRQHLVDLANSFELGLHLLNPALSSRFASLEVFEVMCGYVNISINDQIHDDKDEGCAYHDRAD